MTDSCGIMCSPLSGTPASMEKSVRTGEPTLICCEKWEMRGNSAFAWFSGLFLVPSRYFAYFVGVYGKVGDFTRKFKKPSPKADISKSPALF